MGDITDIQAKNAKPREKSYDLSDGDGLYLRIAPTGTKAWLWRRKRLGKSCVSTIGRYPQVGVGTARKLRDKMKASENNPTVPPPTAAVVPAASSPILREIGVAWHGTQLPLWRTHHANDVLESLKREIWPDLGDVPIADITATQILHLLEKIQQRGAVELAHRLRQRLSAIWSYALVKGIVQTNPPAMLAKGLMPVIQQAHRPAVLTIEEARAVLRGVDTVPAHPITRLALRALALTVVRPGELRFAEWQEVDLDNALWVIPGHRMKHIKRRALSVPDHHVPLSRQAVDVFKAARVFSGKNELVFPMIISAHKPLSENALGYLMNRAGFAGRQSAHGWRATFSTLANERNPADSEVIERMLAHSPSDAVKGAYDRTQHMHRRITLAQEWADWLIQDMLTPEELLKLPRK